MERNPWLSENLPEEAIERMGVVVKTHHKELDEERGIAVEEIDIEIKNKHTLKVRVEDPKFKYGSLKRNAVDVESRMFDLF